MTLIYGIASRTSGRYLSELSMGIAVTSSNFREGLGFNSKTEAQNFLKQHRLATKFQVVSFYGSRPTRPSRGV